MKKHTNILLKSGTIFTLLIILILCSFTTMAVTNDNPSPTKDSEYNLIVYPSTGGTGSKNKISKNYFSASAKEKEGYKFTHWVIKGKYIFKKGSLKSKNIKLLLRSDCEAIPYFKAIKKGVSTTPIKINKSPISPETGSEYGTGSNIILIILFFAFGLVFIVLIAFIIAIISATIRTRRRRKQNNG